MKWAEGIDKLGLGLYFLLCAFAIANIYSVDQETKNLIVKKDELDRLIKLVNEVVGPDDVDFLRDYYKEIVVR